MALNDGVQLLRRSQYVDSIMSGRSDGAQAAMSVDSRKAYSIAEPVQEDGIMMQHTPVARAAIGSIDSPQHAIHDAPMLAISAEPVAKSRGHLSYLDGLRGVAICLVLMVHASQHVIGLSQPVRDLTFYGVRGVQMFFIVSGFTLMMAHVGRPLELANFAARRFFRIAPMFYFGMILYLFLVHATAMSLSTRGATPFDILATLVFLHGWVPSAVNTVVPGGWSIAAEAMFYLVFPAIIAIAPQRRLLAIALLGSYVVAGLTNIVLRKMIGGAAGEALAFPFWLVQFPAFLGGCWLATLSPPGERLRALAPWAMVAAAIGLVIDSQARGHSNLLVAIALLTLFVWSASAMPPRWLNARVLVFLGQISFSFYIVHFAVLGWLAPLGPVLEPEIGAAFAMIAITAATLVLAGAIAAMTYRWIERPIIAATRGIGRRRPA
jgi:peptidoglycan/LPS O-acetylase OafA/YrhL